MKKISISTTTHLSNNPRLVKELKGLSTIKDYNITVIFFQYEKIKNNYDKDIINCFPNIRFITIEWLKKSQPERFFYSLLSKLLLLIFHYTNFCWLAEQQIWPGYLKLKKILKNINSDIYHGHNPGTLAAIVKVAKKKNAKCSFDAEDFHRGEYVSSNINQSLITTIEDLYIPQLDCLLSASPLITKNYQQLFPNIQHLTINNYFPFNPYKKIKPNETKNLKLVWFSQIIGLDRGLQTILLAINDLNFEVNFDIIGAYTSSTFNELTRICNKHLNFIGILSPKSLEKKLVEYNIGFASEPGKDVNNNIALSNKIFSYVQAGLAIIASDTEAQSDFFKSYSKIGYIYQKNQSKQVFEILTKLNSNRKLLHEIQTNSAKLSETLNWENEQEKLKNLLKKLI